MEKPRVVYIIGAGASAEVLPLVKDIHNTLAGHEIDIKANYLSASSLKFLRKDRTFERLHILEEYLRIISDLKDKSRAHESIDTYAKKLFLIDPKSGALFRLKLGLSMFFAYRQAVNGSADRRYDGFLASVLTRINGALRIPDEILVLNWNYDQQLAIAYREYTSNRESEAIHNALQLLSLQDIRPGLQFSIVHLNGLFGYRNDKGKFAPIITTESTEASDAFDDLARFYINTVLDEDSPMHFRQEALSLKFAWEVNAKSNAAMKHLLGNLSECRALVVIGYSFPFFNREIDRAIVGHLTSLERIYVQAPSGGAEMIARTLNSMGLAANVKIELYTNTDKFFLPPDL